MVLLETDSRRGAATLEALAGPAWTAAQLIPDAFGRDRFVIARRVATGLA
jgi:hypothetical protein